MCVIYIQILKVICYGVMYGHYVSSLTFQRLGKIVLDICVVIDFKWDMFEDLDVKEDDNHKIIFETISIKSETLLYQP